MARPIKPARGAKLPQTKLLRIEVSEIKSAAVQRENMRKYIAENLSNAALAVKYGVHERTIEKIMSMKTWSNVR